MTIDVEDEDKMYKPLLTDIYVEMLTDEDDFEIDTGWCDKLQGVEQEDPILRNKRKLEARERPGTSREEQVDECSCHRLTIVMTTKEATIFDHVHVVIDSTPVEERDYVLIIT